jgi:hypothetical protein
MVSHELTLSVKAGSQKYLSIMADHDIAYGKRLIKILFRLRRFET